MLILIPILQIVSAASAENLNNRFDTLYYYFTGYFEPHLITVIVKNQEELTSVLQKTGYNSKKAMKKPAFAPDFCKQTVFAFAGWPCTIINIIEDSTTISIHYREDYRDIDSSNDDREYSRPANVAMIAAIPLTGKTITFVNSTRKQ
jgi:hypothetical protein